MGLVWEFYPERLRKLLTYVNDDLFLTLNGLKYFSSDWFFGTTMRGQFPDLKGQKPAGER